MKSLLAVAAGGALGAVLRYLVYLLAAFLFGTAFPLGTLFVNVAGSFAMGALTEGAALAWRLSTETRLFLGIGILGAFTTFSTFSLDVAVLSERGRAGPVLSYVLLSVFCSIGALFAGMHLVRRIYAPLG